MPTVKVGKAMLLRRWDEAVALAMTPDDAASDAEKAAKAAFQAAWAEAVALAVRFSYLGAGGAVK